MSAGHQLLERVKRKAHEYDKYAGCSQAVLLTLQGEFGIGNTDSFKCASAFGGGIARQGETCGALIGALMALGLVIGRERIEDTETYRAAMPPAQKLCQRFKQEMARQLQFSQGLQTTLCREIQQNLYGRSFDMSQEADYQAFLEAGGHSDKGCPRVCGIAAQVAAEGILELKGSHPAKGI